MRRAAALGALALLSLGPAPAARADRAAARALVEQGRKLEERGDSAGAMASYEAALRADDDYLAAYDAAAPHWIADRRDAEATTRFERATLRHPDYAFGWYTLGYLYRRNGRLHAAVAAYQRCLELRPNDPDAHFGLGLAAVELGDRIDARRAFSRYLALEQRPGQAEFLAKARGELEDLGGPEMPPDADGDEPTALARARRMVDAGTPRAALAALDGRAAAERAGRDAGGRLLRAEALWQLGRVRAAVGELLVALGVRP